MCSGTDVRRRLTPEPDRSGLMRMARRVLRLILTRLEPKQSFKQVYKSHCISCDVLVLGLDNSVVEIALNF